MFPFDSIENWCSTLRFSGIEINAPGFLTAASVVGPMEVMEYRSIHSMSPFMLGKEMFEAFGGRCHAPLSLKDASRRPLHPSHHSCG